MQPSNPVLEAKIETISIAFGAVGGEEGDSDTVEHQHAKCQKFWAKKAKEKLLMTKEPRCPRTQLEGSDRVLCCT